MAAHEAPRYLDSEVKPTVEGLEHVRTNEKGDITSTLHTDAAAPGPVEYDLAASKRLARKMDIHNVPIVALCYLFAFIDRTNM
jgi:hypothetical protein